MLTLSRRGLATSLASVLAAVTATGAAAAPAGATTLTPLVSSGLSMPTTSVEIGTDLWTLDHLNGVCRVNPGAMPPLHDGATCGATAGPAPGAAAGMAYDPVTDNFYIADIGSNTGAIYRLHRDAQTGDIGEIVRIVDLQGDRATAVTLVPSLDGGAPDVLYTTKRSDQVFRVNDPDALPQDAVAVAFAGGPAPEGIAYLDGQIYLIELGVVTRAALNSFVPATPVTGFPGGAAGAILADPERGRLYAGTVSAGLNDQVDVLDPATEQQETYVTGLAGVFGLGLLPDGDLLVADDPATAAGALDSEFQGRLWRAELAPLGRPSARVDQGPASVSAIGSVTFAYSAADGSAFECRLGDAAWAACPGTGTGEVTYDGLGEGTYRFGVRAVSPDPAIGPGLEATRTFVLDRTAPTVKIITTPAEAGSGDAPQVEWVVSEAGVSTSCSLNGGPFMPCHSGDRWGGLAEGQYELRILATDMAGNMNDPLAPSAALRFRVGPEPKVDDQRDEQRSGDRFLARSGVRLLDAGAPGAPVLHPFRLRPVRVVTRPQRPRGPQLRMSVVVPHGARVAHVEIRRATRGKVRKPTVRRALRVRNGGRTKLKFRLTAAESRRLAPGLYIVTMRMADDGRQGNVQGHWFRVARG